MKNIKQSLLFLSLLFWPIYSAADDFLVDAPNVQAGDKTIEADLTYGAGNGHSQNGYFGQHYGINYGISDYWETAFFGEFEREPDNAPYASHVEWENIFVPFKAGTHWLDLGFFTELDKATNNDVPDNFDARLLLQKDAGKFSNVANIILNRSFGPHAQNGTGMGFSWITTYAFSDDVAAGVQYTDAFGIIGQSGNFNSQEHVFGPVIEGKIGELNYTTGLLLGVTSGAAAATVRVDLEYGF